MIRRLKRPHTQLTEIICLPMGLVNPAAADGEYDAAATVE
jgi:hypothetical protein